MTAFAAGGHNMHFRLLATLVLGAVAADATAQSEFVWERYSQRLDASRKLAPLRADAFGDRVSLAHGALSFSVTDVSIPGNNALPVAVTRSYEVRSKKVADNFMFGDWDIEVPNINAVFATNWVVDHNSPATRCSSADGAPTQAASTLGGDLRVGDFWRGINVSIPGVASGEMLRQEAGTQRPTNGVDYRWVTADGMVHFSCLATVKNTTGEGFLAIDSSGTRYWFDWMAQYVEPALNTSLSNYPHRPASFALRKNVLYATRVEDRFGNYVTYTYTNAWNAPAKLTTISSSDGRQVSFTYSGNRVSAVSDGSRTWSYAYQTTPKGRPTLSQVTLPDASKWTLGLAQFTDAEIKFSEVVTPGEIIRTCTMGQLPENEFDEPVGTVSHPAGATATYRVFTTRHGRASVPLSCRNVTTTPADATPGTNNDVNDDVPLYPSSFYSLTLKSKSVSGPALPAMTWTYAYQPNFSYVFRGGATRQYPVCSLPGTQCSDPVCTSDSCASASITTVTAPDGSWERHYYGNTFKYNEGKLLRVVKGTGADTAISTLRHAYDLAQTGTPYPTRFGASTRFYSDGWAEAQHRPLVSTTVEQDGTSFASTTTTFDAFARPLAITRGSTLGYSRSETRQYHDMPSKWVMGQVSQVARAGVIEHELTYDPVSALQLTYKKFGALRQTLTWNADGTVATIKDGNNQTTTLSNWYRGIPRSIRHPDNTTQLAVVSAAGWITSVTDENGYTTGYGYDSMGRLSAITYPTGDSTAWSTTTQAFARVAADEYGIPAGHWRLTVSTGNGRNITYYDGLWRPVLTREYDAANETATRRFQRFAYDHEGRTTFQSYPGATDSLSAGTWTAYDVLGRPVSTSQTSELGTLTTTYTYLPGFQTRVTDPKGNQTTTSFQAWDQPTQDYPVSIVQPEGVYTDIARDAFGKPTAITQRNAGGTLAVSRRYVYNARQELCKTIEPETGATVMAYDNAGNLSWSASGLSLPSLTDCNTANVTASQKISRAYDSRNRLISLSVPGSQGSQSWTYTPDGLPSSVTTYNDGGSSTVVNAYTYNKRRLLTGESQVQTGATTWAIGYGYNANGHLASLTYPADLTVNYVPNALGQPTQAGSFATGVQYYPNGAIKQFTYGNGVVHTMAQNARQLPARSTDSLGVLDLGYAYDGNGNVASITDHTSLGRQTRSMGYDGRDRLLTVSSPLYPGGATYAYDVLDNLTRVTVAGRDHRYVYDANNRLTNVTNGPGGPSVVGLGYDARGNLNNRNGQVFQFDHGNRLRSALGTESYRYDAWGRRTLSVSEGGLLYEMYSRDGQLLWQRDELQGLRFQHVWLGGSLVASRRLPIGSTTATVTYRHTDALGSPIAATDESGGVVQRTEHEPYGKMLNRNNDNRPGYTGHMMDKGTGLVYMQQRYYDPQLGRFLSIDPVTAYGGDIRYFNRYWYAAGNPYKYTDPDGRILDTVADVGFIAYSAYKLATEPSWTNAAALGADVVGAAVPFATGLGSGVRAAAHAGDVAGAGKKAATLADNVAQGKAGEAATRAKLGDSVAGEQVTFKTSDGTRTRADFVTKDRGVVETKTGGAQLSTGQGKLKADIDAGRQVTPVGKNAEKAGLPPGQPTTMKSCTVDRPGC
ncbi:MAG TPA: RHS repeat-associated core domain-containing protein [Pseudoxanthomonas sp.]|nr:RHS repeat-associated core domain-containing protein [Pseudoxanthomonas sp.]